MMKQCADCDHLFDPINSIDDIYCDVCRLQMPPCVECGAEDELEAPEKCIHEAHESCHGDKLWG